MPFQNQIIFLSLLPLGKLMDNTKWTGEKNTHFVIKNLNNTIFYSDKSCRRKLFRTLDLSCFSIFYFTVYIYWKIILIPLKNHLFLSHTDLLHQHLLLLLFVYFGGVFVVVINFTGEQKWGSYKSEPNSITLISQSITPFSINNKLFYKDVLGTS